MPSIFKRIDTVFLQVSDFEQAIKWYGDVLGFKLRWKDDIGGYAALEIGETPLTLVRTNRNEKPVKNNYISFNFYTSDIEQAHQYLVENDVNVEPINEDKNVKWFKFQDLEGNYLEVCHFQE
ncbi:VOC family protein [Psychrobacillus sp. FJAT-51614]|uniref:VOC family protein n=1 Tax=Psychrobacillus mangrovi TaxID=3117745 RepID=A0ABU8F4N8_9BACI